MSNMPRRPAGEREPPIRQLHPNRLQLFVPTILQTVVESRPRLAKGAARRPRKKPGVGEAWNPCLHTGRHRGRPMPAHPARAARHKRYLSTRSVYKRRRHTTEPQTRAPHHSHSSTSGTGRDQPRRCSTRPRRDTRRRPARAARTFPSRARLRASREDQIARKEVTGLCPSSSSHRRDGGRRCSTTSRARMSASRRC
jgi:hypothetical protein